MIAGLPRADDDAFARLGDAVYERIAPRLTHASPGDYVVMDVDSGDYEVDSKHLAAVDRLRQRHPQARMWVRQVGRRFVRVFGSHRREEAE